MSKILIVEDERDVSKVLKKRLIDSGFEAIVAGDGYQAVQMAHKDKPDLIILDLMLPAGGGLKVLQNLRSSTYTDIIPVVVLTGIQDQEYKKKIINEGVDAYLEKPYDPDMLITTVTDVLSKKT